MSDTITLVCGFGRCGSSLVMQMLVAGGIRSFGGEYPTYEAPEVNSLPYSYQWLKQAQGMAVKVLDPHMRLTWAAPTWYLPFRSIWIDREPKEQAKSMAKFLAAMAPHLPAMGRGQRKALEHSFRRDRKKSVDLLCALGPVLVTSFECLLGNPRQASEEVALFCGCLDAEAMRQVVRPRGPACLPYMMELELMEEAGA